MYSSDIVLVKIIWIVPYFFLYRIWWSSCQVLQLDRYWAITVYDGTRWSKYQFTQESKANNTRNQKYWQQFPQYKVLIKKREQSTLRASVKYLSCFIWRYSVSLFLRWWALFTCIWPGSHQIPSASDWVTS